MIELMVALALTGIVLISIYNLYATQSRVYTVQEQVADMQQNARVASNVLSRHIRMAAYGQPHWTNINGATVTYEGIRVTDGGTGNPDTIDIVGCIDEPPGTLASGGAAIGDTSITLQSSAEASEFNTSSKCDIFIGERENAKVTGISGAALTVDTNPSASGNQGLTYSYNANANVYLVKRMTYAITNANLTRDENTGSGAQQVALNIEDMQANFLIPSVALSITARTKTQDRDYGYRRMTINSDIIARNLE